MHSSAHRAVGIANAGPVTWSAPKIFYTVKQFWVLPRQAPPAAYILSRIGKSPQYRRAELPIFQEVTKSEVQPIYFYQAASREKSWRETVTLRKSRQLCEHCRAPRILCKTRGQRVQTTWQNYVGAFPHKLWKAVGKTSSAHPAVDNHTSYPTYTPPSSTRLSTQLIHLSHLFRRNLSALSTRTTITTTTNN